MKAVQQFAAKPQVSARQFQWSGQIKVDQIDFMNAGQLPAGCDCSCACATKPDQTGKKKARSK